jgi:hypothetical protein
MRSLRHFVADGFLSVLLLTALHARAAAGPTHDLLYQVYTSTSTPFHYKKAVAKLLKLPQLPSFPAGVLNSGLTKNTALPSASVRATMSQMLSTCKTARPGCRSILFRNAPPGAVIKISGPNNSLLRQLNTDPSGSAAWDETDANGNAVPAGAYTALVQSAIDSKSFMLVVP